MPLGRYVVPVVGGSLCFVAARIAQIAAADHVVGKHGSRKDGPGELVWDEYLLTMHALIFPVFFYLFAWLLLGRPRVRDKGFVPVALLAGLLWFANCIIPVAAGF